MTKESSHLLGAIYEARGAEPWTVADVMRLADDFENIEVALQALFPDERGPSSQRLGKLLARCTHPDGTQKTRDPGEPLLPLTRHGQLTFRRLDEIDSRSKASRYAVAPHEYFRPKPKPAPAVAPGYGTCIVGPRRRQDVDSVRGWQHSPTAERIAREVAAALGQDVKLYFDGEGLLHIFCSGINPADERLAPFADHGLKLMSQVETERRHTTDHNLINPSAHGGENVCASELSALRRALNPPPRKRAGDDLSFITKEWASW